MEGSFASVTVKLTVARQTPTIAIASHAGVLRVPGVPTLAHQQPLAYGVDVAVVRDSPEMPWVATAPVRTVSAGATQRVAVMAFMVNVKAGRDRSDQRAIDKPVGRVPATIDHHLDVALAVAAASDRVTGVKTAGCVDQGDDMGRKLGMVRVHRSNSLRCCGAAGSRPDRSFSMLAGQQ